MEQRARSDSIVVWIISVLLAAVFATTGIAKLVGFEPIGRVTLLVREVRAQVRQPAMVPAIR